MPVRKPAARAAIDELKAELRVAGGEITQNVAMSMVDAAPKMATGAPTIGEVRARKIAAHLGLFTRAQAHAIVDAYFDGVENVNQPGAALK